MTKLLLMDYDTNLVYIIKYELECMIGGYEVMIATNKQEGINLWEKERPDAIVCDAEMLGENACNISIKIRQEDENAILLFMLSESSPKDVISAYNSGVTGYLKKPFIPEELSAYIQSLLRFKYGKYNKKNPDLRKMGDCILNVGHCTLINQQKENKIALTARETEILKMLCEEKGGIVKRDRILKKVWYTKDENDFYASRSFDVLLSNLRKKIILEGIKIKTIRGVGISLDSE